MCYKNYPTIVNKIPKDSRIYDYDMKNFAIVDNSLAAAQLAIGESSNLAQLCLTYTYNHRNQKFSDYVCILSVLAQVAIDNAKRKFDIDLNDEIAHIKNDVTTKNNLPKFWQITKRDKRKVRTEAQRKARDKKNRERIEKNLNKKLVCPMNYIYDQKLTYIQDETETIDIGKFWIKHEQNKNDYRKSKTVEAMIQRFSLDLYNFNVSDKDDIEDYLLLRSDFEDLIKNIRGIYISSSYEGLMSWLINRAFRIGAGAKGNAGKMDSTLYKNRSLLMKVLYMVNPKAFLNCFIQDVDQ